MPVVEPSFVLERRLLREHPILICLDEVGRGALAGPVAVGATVVDAAAARRRVPQGLRDSKLVPEKRRAEVAGRAGAWAPASAVGWAGSDEIDEVGIMRALGLAASRAILAACGDVHDAASALVLLDGNHDYVSAVHPGALNVRPIIKADRDCAAVSAASVLAKVARDALMVELSAEFPAYQWERNKGYASPEHREAIRERGLSRHHRSSWAIAEAPTLF
ncbi:ribonuclease HII [Microbacterium capsulatum]|uniref:Ribonuclease n=1 Tax=Microbacterium capsulatum TaxID=3041921 RepID=A0ABU0XDX0_9MICO|nr:ribonuclease HII [Microbacterium sp. ASV81]MDQ4213261.1 ribonuclease HII [Microbacterium sp. ASV81]